VPELDDIPSCRIELAEQRSQPRLCIAMTGWKLEQKAAHSVAKDVGNQPKIPYQRFRTPKPFDMSDKFADFDCVNEMLLASLPGPRFDRCDGWP
jgi:hypothetical protein